MRYAIVRPPGRSYVHCLSEDPDRETIDYGLALRQHAAYCEALAAEGVTIIALPPLEQYPDACFVEDTAVVRGEKAVVASLGAESRRGEETSVAAVLAEYKRLHHIKDNATLEGGDILQAGELVFAGISQRTCWAGAQQLADHLELSRYRAVPVRGVLHLKTACTYLGRGMILATERCPWLSEFSEYRLLLVPAEEAYAANTLTVGEKVFVPRGFPRTQRMIEEHGLGVCALDISEFRKGGGGLTCLSILFDTDR